MKPSKCANGIRARPQSKVIGIAENHVGPRRCNLIDRQTLYSALRADRHETRRFDGTMGRLEGSASGTGRRIGVVQLETERHEAEVTRMSAS